MSKLISKIKSRQGNTKAYTEFFNKLKELEKERDGIYRQFLNQVKNEELKKLRKEIKKIK